MNQMKKLKAYERLLEEKNFKIKQLKKKYLDIVNMADQREK